MKQRDDDAFSGLGASCDPGIAYGLRKISTERIFRKRYKQSYDWFVKREQIDSPYEIIDQLSHHFRIIHRRFFSLMVPLIDLNLCIGMVLRKRLGPIL